MGRAQPIQAAVADALPIETIVGEYVSEMRRQGRRDARNEERIIRRVSRGCGWRTLVDVTAASVRAYLQDAHARGLSASSANNTLSALVGLVDFLIQTGRASENWAKAIPRSRGERGDGARALTLAEVARLIEVARHAEAHDKRCKGCVRSDVHQVAAFTGLRGKEPRALRVRHCLLDATPPRLALTPHVQKGRRPKAVDLPLHPDAWEALTRACAGKGPDDPVFPTFPSDDTLRRDLARAGIPFRDARGRTASFHSFRKAFVTGLAAAGAGQRSTQALARHASPTMTANVYTDAALLPLAAELARLPRLGETLENAIGKDSPIKRLATSGRWEYGPRVEVAMTSHPHITPDATGLSGPAASTPPADGLVAQGVRAACTTLDSEKRAKGLEPSGSSAAQGITHALVIGLRAVLAALEGAADVADPRHHSRRA